MAGLMVLGPDKAAQENHPHGVSSVVGQELHKNPWGDCLRTTPFSVLWFHAW